MAQHSNSTSSGRQIRYRAIAEDLRTRILDGALTVGAVLPSESELAATHGASRVTVRKALDVLRDEGLVESRQGFGWIVAGDRVRQSLDVLATIESQLVAHGRSSERRIRSFAFVAPPERVRAALGLAPTDEVLEVVRINVVDETPFAEVTVWCPAALAGGLSRDDVGASPFVELLPVSISHAVQTVGAAAATESDAEVLGVPAGSPLLVAERVSYSVDRDAVLMSQHRFPAHLTEFVVETSADPAGAGLRLVDPSR